MTNFFKYVQYAVMFILLIFLTVAVVKKLEEKKQKEDVIQETQETNPFNDKKDVEDEDTKDSKVENEVALNLYPDIISTSAFNAIKDYISLDIELYNNVHTQKTEPLAQISAVELDKAYKHNELAADKKYKGKEIVVTSTVNSVKQNEKGEYYAILRTNGLISDLEKSMSSFKSDLQNEGLDSEGLDANIDAIGELQANLGLKAIFKDDEKDFLANLDAKQQVKIVCTCDGFSTNDTGNVRRSNLRRGLGMDAPRLSKCYSFEKFVKEQTNYFIELIEIRFKEILKHNPKIVQIYKGKKQLILNNDKHIDDIATLCFIGFFLTIPEDSIFIIHASTKEALRQIETKYVNSFVKIHNSIFEKYSEKDWEELTVNDYIEIVTKERKKAAK